MGTASALEARLSLIQGECDHRIYPVSAARGDFGLGVLKTVPQRLKPSLAYGNCGTTEAAPFVESFSAASKAVLGLGECVTAKATPFASDRTIRTNCINRWPLSSPGISASGNHAEQ